MIGDRHGLMSAEAELIAAAERGTEADLRMAADGQEPVIRAQVLRDLILGTNPQWPVKDAVRLTGARVRGGLDLAATQVPHPLRFNGCTFEDRIDLRFARTREPIEWNGGHTATVIADEFESAADLIFRHVTMAGPISLHWANVRGDLRLTDSRLSAIGGQVFNGRDLRVGGSLFLDGPAFQAEGEVCLRSAHVQGEIDCRHAFFANPSGIAIDADHLDLDGELLLEDGFRSLGEVSLQWAKLRRLRATGATFVSSTPYALHADALRAEAGVYLDRGFHATATVRLVGANITGELCCTNGHFDNAGGRALDATRVVADDVYLDHGFRADGDVRLDDARITRQLNATEGRFRNDRVGEGEYALDCDGLNCGADVFLNQGFDALGTVSLRGAEIQAELNCTGGSFSKPGGYALFADGMTTPGTVFLDTGFRADGEVRLARATIGRQLVCSGGAFSNRNDVALDLSGLITSGDVLLDHGFHANGEVRLSGSDVTRDLDFTGARLDGPVGLIARAARVGGRFKWKMDDPPEGRVDLSLADIGKLDDTPGSWRPGKYNLSGTAYGIATDAQMSIEHRLGWLRATSTYSAEAYQHLARYYSLKGDEKSADKAAIQSQRDLRTRCNLGWPSRLWNKFVDVFVGYGYKMHRPFVALVVAALVGGVIFWVGQHAGLIVSTGSPHTSALNAPPETPPFYPFPYAFQLLIPGLDLHETANWLPNASQSGWGLFLMVVVFLLIVLGWVLATAVVAGITRIFRQR